MKNRGLMRLQKAVEAWGECVDECVDAFLAKDWEKHDLLEQKCKYLRDEMIRIGDDYFLVQDVKEVFFNEKLC